MPNLYEDRVNNSPALQQLRQAAEDAGAATKKHHDQLQEASEEDRAHLDRARAVIQNVLARLTLNDPNLIQDQVLRALQSPSSSLASTLNAFLANGDLGRLASISSHADSLLLVANLPPEPPGTTSSLMEVATRAVERLAQVRTTVDRLSGEADRRSNQITETLQGLENSFGELRAELVERFDKQFEQLEQKGKQASDILSLVAGEALGGQYRREQSTQGWLAWLFTMLGIGSVIALIYIGVILFIGEADDIAKSLSEVAGRFLRQSPLIGALVAIATILLRRAAYHRSREERAKRIADELTLLRPFVDTLPEDQRNTLLYLVAPRYFLGGTSNVRVPDDMEALTALARQLRQDSPTDTPAETNQ